MDTKKIAYFLRDALEGVWFNRNIVISAVIIVMSSLCLFGIYSLFSMNIDYISEQFREQYAVTAYLEKGTPEDRIEEIKDEIGQISNVATIEFTSEEQALEECKELFADDSSLLSGLEKDNPLRASFEVTLNDLKQAKQTSEKLGEIIDVSWVKNNQDFVRRIIDMTAFMRNGSLLAMILFSIISVFIIANTVKILVVTRKDDILSMRYLGATNDFIICPFVIEGAIIGIIGAVAALIFIAAGYTFTAHELSVQLPNFIKIYYTHQVIIKLTIYLLIFGLMLGIFGSVFSIRKHIKA